MVIQELLVQQTLETLGLHIKTLTITADPSPNDPYGKAADI